MVDSMGEKCSSAYAKACGLLCACARVVPQGAVCDLPETGNGRSNVSLVDKWHCCLALFILVGVFLQAVAADVVVLHEDEEVGFESGQGAGTSLCAGPVVPQGGIGIDGACNVCFEFVQGLPATLGQDGKRLLGVSTCLLPGHTQVVVRPQLTAGPSLCHCWMTSLAKRKAIGSVNTGGGSTSPRSSAMLLQYCIT